MSDEPPRPEPPRCSEHGLVTSPDGCCVLCRRSSPPPEPDEHARSSVLPVVAAVVVVLGAVGAFALYRLRSSPDAAPTRPPPKAEPTVRLVTTRDDRPRDQGADRTPMTIRLTPRTPPPEGSPPPGAPPVARRIALRQAPRRAPPSPAPSTSKDELEALAARARMNRIYARAARQNNQQPVQIIMYMTSW